MAHDPTWRERPDLPGELHEEPTIPEPDRMELLTMAADLEGAFDPEFDRWVVVMEDLPDIAPTPGQVVDTQTKKTVNE